MNKFYFWLLAMFPLQVFAQDVCEQERYQNRIFEEVYVNKDVVYGQAEQWSFPFSIIDLHMDIYEPIGDTLSKRPLMIWAHPGAFITGQKDVDDMVALCDTFAKRGYVTASIQYRLGYNPFDSESAERAVFRGTQDGRAAFRYFKEFHSIYDIDTTRMFIGGSSAGGFLSLHLAYLQEEERPESTLDMPCLDCSGNDYQHTVDPLGIVSMWGALGDSSYRDENDTLPVLLIHGTADAVVSYGVGSPFDLDFLPVSHGSGPIANQSEALGLPYELVAIEGEDHEPHGASNGTFEGEPTEYWDTILNRVGNFYFDLIKPQTSNIIGEPIFCLDGTNAIYSVPFKLGSKYCWEIEGGDIIENNSNEIVVAWEGTGVGILRVQELNEVNCKGDWVEKEVNLLSIPEANFSFVETDGSIQFIDNSINASSWSWDFGDGNVSNEQNPMHTYGEEGSYVVTLQAVSLDGCAQSFSDTLSTISTSLVDLNLSDGIQVFPNPIVDDLHYRIEGSVPLDLTIWGSDGRLLLEAENLINEGVLVLPDYRGMIFCSWSNGVWGKFLVVE